MFSRLSAVVALVSGYNRLLTGDDRTTVSSADSDRFFHRARAVAMYGSQKKGGVCRAIELRACGERFRALLVVWRGTILVKRYK